MLVDSLAMPSGARLPPGHGALVQVERRHDGLEGTAVAEQGEDDHQQVRRVVQPIERGAGGGGEGVWFPLFVTPPGFSTS
jgi:hypothetical protein